MSQAHARTGQFSKVGENLFRYSSNGKYYAVFRVDGKLKWKSLRTTDRMLAKRRLTDEIKKARTLNPEMAKLQLEGLIKIYENTLQTKDQKTIKTRKSILKKFKSTWQFGLQMEVNDVTPSNLKGWLGLHRERLKKSSYNEYLRFLRQLFQEAVDAKVIVESPAAELTELRRERPIRQTPTPEEFQAIVADIRAQRFNAEAEDSADLCEFLGLAGAGLAEADNLLGEHVDFHSNKVTLYRQKTDTGFTIPMFPQLRPLLERLRDAGRLQRGQKVFKVRDPKKALKAACTRLKLPTYSSRALRRCFITKAVEKGVDFKTISAWQGHRDGGVLIARTYSHLRDEHSDNMAKNMV